MKKILTLITVALFIYSCNSKENKENEIKDEEVRIEEAKKSLKRIAIDSLIKKYNITYHMDSVRFRFSIDYTPLLSSKYQIIDRFTVNDIFQKDSTYFVSISFRGIRDFTFPISQEQVTLFSNKTMDKILVVSIKYLKKIKFAFVGEVEDEESASVALTNSTGFFATGELIEITSLNK